MKYYYSSIYVQHPDAAGIWLFDEGEIGNYVSDFDVQIQKLSRT